MPKSWVQANVNQAQGIADEEYLELHSTDLRPPCGACYAAPEFDATALGPCVVSFCRQSERLEEFSAPHHDLRGLNGCFGPPCRQSSEVEEISASQPDLLMTTACFCSVCRLSEDHEEMQASQLPPPPVYCRQSA